MGKRRADADHRRFLDEFECVKIPRLRATGVVQLDAPHTIIQVGDRHKLIGLAHVRFRNGGSWSLFRCPTMRAQGKSPLAHRGQAALPPLL